MSTVDAEEERQAELALNVLHTARPEVARIIFEDGVRHIQALQIASHALDARATQIATILFAAAALSASAIGTELNLGAILAGCSMGFFIWGGLISFRAIQSATFRAPGLPPAWWKGILDEPRDDKNYAIFTERSAVAWAAQEQQRAIYSVCHENEHRGDAINASLRAAWLGAICIAVAAALKLWPGLVELLDAA